MKGEQAQAIGQDALIWLAARPEALEAILATIGAAPASLRAQASDPHFLAALIDFLLGADETVIAFADACGIRPDVLAADLGRARAALVGETPSWT